MIDVLVLVSVNSNDLNSEVLNKFENHKKYLGEKIKEILSDNDISNNILFVDYKNDKDINSEIKCFFNIELNKSNDRNKVEIFSTEVENKSYELAKELNNNLTDISEINYNVIDFEGSDLSCEIAKAYLKIFLNDNAGNNDETLNKIATLLSVGIGKYLGININLSEKKNTIPLINNNIINKNKAKQFSEDMGISEKIINLIDYYWEFSKEHGNVNPVIAYAQAIVTIEQNKVDYNYFNPGGIKDAKVNSLGVHEYKKFNSLIDGIKAQLDHLALFGGAEGYPRIDSKDPRHFKYLFGSCKTIDSLSGKWDSDKDYGDNIIKIYKEIYSINDFQEFSEATISTGGLENKINKFSEKLIVMGNLLENIFKEYSLLYKDLDDIKKEILAINEEKKEYGVQKEELENKVLKQKNVIKDILNVIGGSLEKK